MNMQIQTTGPLFLPVIPCNPLQNWPIIFQKAQEELGKIFAGLCPLKLKNPVSGEQKCSEKDWIKIPCSLKSGNGTICRVLTFSPKIKTPFPLPFISSQAISMLLTAAKVILINFKNAADPLTLLEFPVTKISQLRTECAGH